MKEETKKALNNFKDAAKDVAEKLSNEAKELGNDLANKTQEISAKLVKQLRDKTDAGIMECKNALKECAGDIEKAMEYLRQKGLSKAAKKADRIAADGVIALKIAEDFSKATLVEVNSETDFVAKNAEFQELVDNVLDLAFRRAINYDSGDCSKSLMELTINNQTFEEYLKQKIATIGENIVIRRVKTINCKKGEILNGYLHHNKKVGAIVLLKVDNEGVLSDSKKSESLKTLAKYLSMQVASMKPKVISYKELDSTLVEKERTAIAAEIEKENEELARLQKTLKRVPEFVSRLELNDSVLAKKEAELKEVLKKEGKPEKIWDKILPGQLERFILDNTLLDQRLTLLAQSYTMDDKKSVEQVLKEESAKLGVSIEVASFTNFELGEGIEKKVDDFAAEVAAQMK